MIVSNHQIAYQNVVSKYYNFAPEEIDEAIRDFNNILQQDGYNAIGTVFYSMIIEPVDGIMTAELFIPIEESTFSSQSDEQMYFRSYFNINPMIMTRLTKDFDRGVERKFVEMANHLKREGFSAKTPLFVEFKTNHSGDTYMEMSIGI